ncbi:MAG: metallophosphoesterase [Flavobacteriales bacterium]|nr:metallophosphoesterase [Flavobacteriales bacterium]
MRRFLLFLVCLAGLGASAQRSPYNDLSVGQPDSTGRFRVLIGGHFHGESTNRSGYPAATLLASMDTLNALGADLLLSTGDLFMDPREAKGDVARYRKSFFSKLRMPLFNAPGNHDVSRIGDTFPHGAPWEFTAAGRRFIILDSEANDGNLSKVELSMLDKARADADRGAVDEVYIVGHRPVWAEAFSEYGDLFKGNTRGTLGTDFSKRVVPILEQIAATSPVFWISGSLGGGAPSSIFFHEHAPGITFVQCAIRDLPRDALLIADLYPDSSVWSALSLTGRQMLAPEEYDLSWWRSHVGVDAPFNWRLLPYYCWSTIAHRAFWWGFGAAVVLLLLLLRRLRR